MRMSQDHFAALGLAPGRYRPTEIRKHFEAARREALRDLALPEKYLAARQRLDQIYRAYNTLRDPQRLSELLDEQRAHDRTQRMRRLIESSLEGGLLRHSRRQAILKEGRRLGFSEFHTQLMIAQVQFGDRELLRAVDPAARPAARAVARVGARFTAVGVVALAMFLAMIRWLGV